MIRQKQKKNKANTKKETSVPVFLKEKAASLAPAIRMLLRDDNNCIVSHRYDTEIGEIISSKKTFSEAYKIFNDYRIGNQKGLLFIDDDPEIESLYAGIQKAIQKLQKKHEQYPAMVVVQNTGLFAVSETKQDADNIIQDFLSVWKEKKNVAEIRDALSDKSDESIVGRADGKIAIITGSAQGFGKGIAESLAEQGAYVIIADIKEALAKEVAASLCRIYGPGRAKAIAVDVTQEESIKNLMVETVLAYGGIDIFISNAGILNAGSLEEMKLDTFELVTKINYSSYYLGTKYASRFMKIQYRFDNSYFGDIIQINSKSGLERSNKNFAYAGGKFGGIGLTQSFALELIDYNIKVNAICPGNLFEGPLWADPKNGLFAQYLRTKKVPGARTIEDVKRFYENKVPMKRGCTVHDVALAVFYIIEQKYETGQAVPVTGGQVMLR